MPIADVMTLSTQKPVSAEAMAIRTVIVALSGLSSDAPLLKRAIAVARQFGARLVALHVHLDARLVAMSLAASDPIGAGGLIGDMMRDADMRQAAAKRTFDAVCGEASLPTGWELPQGRPSAGWVAVKGDEAALLASYGRCADLVILPRPDGPEGAPLDVAEAALFGCGRPLLLLPPGAHATVGGTVVVAWKDTPEAARAIAGATPFIQLADKVVVVTAVEDEDDFPDPSAERIVTALERHNPSVTLHRLLRDERRPVDALLDTAMERGAGLLVMGGYGHSRAREIIFGGFTRAVLRKAPLPVLMAH